MKVHKNKHVIRISSRVGDMHVQHLREWLNQEHVGSEALAEDVEYDQNSSFVRAHAMMTCYIEAFLYMNLQKDGHSSPTYLTYHDKIYHLVEVKELPKSLKKLERPWK